MKLDRFLQKTVFGFIFFLFSSLGLASAHHDIHIEIDDGLTLIYELTQKYDESHHTWTPTVLIKDYFDLPLQFLCSAGKTQIKAHSKNKNRVPINAKKSVFAVFVDSDKRLDLVELATWIKQNKDGNRYLKEKGLHKRMKLITH